MVTYCTDDNVALSVEHKVIEPLGHDKVYHDAKAATCTEPGWQAYQTCTRCYYSTYVEIPATGHVHTATREENRHEPTCTEAGSYDLVTYCTDDNVELSREGQTIPALGHDLVHHDAKAPTVTEIGWEAYDTCTRCSYTTYVELAPIASPEYTPISAGRTYMQYMTHTGYTLSCAPSKTAAKLLVIPVWFSDSSNYIKTTNRENIRGDIEKAYFGSNEDTGWRSVKTFYEEESHGALSLTGTVSDWYIESRSSSSFASEDTGMDNTIELVNTAADWYFNNHQDDARTNYDCNGDGWLDGVMLIYAAPDYYSSSNYSNGNFWAYCYWVQQRSYKSTTNPGANVFFWASYDFMYGSNKAYSRTGKSSYAGGDTTNCNIDAHTFTHEMGHVFGLDDYYDYSNHGYSPAGGFSMQDHNVGGHDPYSVFALGWGQAYVPTESAVINLKPFTTSGEMIILSPKWNSYDSPFDEYLILEFYTPTGLNQFDATYQYANSTKGPNEYGIRLWHVDSRLVYLSNSSSDWSATKTTTNPLYGTAVSLMMSNTYDDGNSSTAGYLSPLGSEYADYNLLQLIRNNKTITYKPTTNLSKSQLFRKDSEFKMEDFKSQFVKETKLNNDKTLGFSFKVTDITTEYASVAITKL